MARTAFASVRAMSDSATDSPPTAATSQPHPRFAEALTALGLTVEVRRADAAVVREATGYAIGGVPPFGHRTRTPVLADRAILAHGTVWAAAGTPHTVFPLDPQTLLAHAGARLVDVREQTS